LLFSAFRKEYSGREDEMSTKFLFIIVSGLVLVFLSGCAGTTPAPETREPPAVLPDEESEQPQGELIIKTDSSGLKYIVDPEKLVGGGPPKDGIPSIDEPEFITLKEADEWIEDNELVLAIDYRGVKRVYPLQILVLHEIVNDIVAGDPLLITY